MTVNDWIHTIAGTFIVVSLSLGIWVHPPVPFLTSRDDQNDKLVVSLYRSIYRPFLD